MATGQLIAPRTSSAHHNRASTHLHPFLQRKYHRAVSAAVLVFYGLNILQKSISGCVAPAARTAARGSTGGQRPCAVQTAVIKCRGCRFVLEFRMSERAPAAWLFMAARSQFQLACSRNSGTCTHKVFLLLPISMLLI
jgi:hypothetical protein